MNIHGTCNCEQIITNVHRRTEGLFLLEKEKRYLENYLVELNEKEIKLNEETEYIKSTLRISRKYNFALKNQLQLNNPEPKIVLEVIPESNKLIIKYEKNWLDSSEEEEDGSDSAYNRKINLAYKFLTLRVEMYKKIELSISHFIDEVEVIVENKLNKSELQKQFYEFKFLNEQYIILLNNRSKIAQKFFENIQKLVLKRDTLIFKKQRPPCARGELKMIMSTLERQDQKVSQLKNDLTALKSTYDELNERKKLKSAKEKGELMELAAELGVKKKNISTLEATRNLNLSNWKKRLENLRNAFKEIKNRHSMVDHINCNCWDEITNLKKSCQLLSGKLHKNYNL